MGVVGRNGYDVMVRGCQWMKYTKCWVIFCTLNQLGDKYSQLNVSLPPQMKCTGIPELTSIKDLDYLKSVMVLDRSEEQAADHFRQQIQECLKKAWSTQINWLSHNFAHSHS